MRACVRRRMRRDGREGESGSGARNRRIRSPRRDVAEGKAVVARPSAPSRARVRRIPAAAEPPLRTHRHRSFRVLLSPACCGEGGGEGGRGRARGRSAYHGAPGGTSSAGMRARAQGAQRRGRRDLIITALFSRFLFVATKKKEPYPHEPKPFPSRAAAEQGRQARRPAACTMAARKLAGPPRAAHSSKGPPPGMAPARCPGCAHGRCVRFA